jgi:hypothetical protein
LYAPRYGSSIRRHSLKSTSYRTGASSDVGERCDERGAGAFPELLHAFARGGGVLRAQDAGQESEPEQDPRPHRGADPSAAGRSRANPDAHPTNTP